MFESFLEKSQVNGPWAEKWQDGKSKRTRQKKTNKTGIMNGESNDGPKITDKGVGAEGDVRRPQPPFGVVVMLKAQEWLHPIMIRSLHASLSDLFKSCTVYMYSNAMLIPGAKCVSQKTLLFEVQCNDPVLKEVQNSSSQILLDKKYLTSVICIHRKMLPIKSSTWHHIPKLGNWPVLKRKKIKRERKKRGNWPFVTKLCWLRQNYVCRDKHVFVVTKVLLWQAYFCRNKRRVLSWQTCVCLNKRVCRDKTFVTTKIILVAAPVNDTAQMTIYSRPNEGTSGMD